MARTNPHLGVSPVEFPWTPRVLRASCPRRGMKDVYLGYPICRSPAGPKNLNTHDNIHNLTSEVYSFSEMEMQLVDMKTSVDSRLSLIFGDTWIVNTFHVPDQIKNFIVTTREHNLHFVLGVWFIERTFGHVWSIFITAFWPRVAFSFVRQHRKEKTMLRWLTLTHYSS